jgi:hypothetical protein
MIRGSKEGAKREQGGSKEGARREGGGTENSYFWI